MSVAEASTLFDAYLKAYGAIGSEERTQLLQQSVADDVVFTNPGGDGKSRDGLIAHIEDFRRKMPDAYFKTDKVYTHHSAILAIWSMYKGNDTKLATGYNFVQCDEDGRFNYMAGFF